MSGHRDVTVTDPVSTDGDDLVSIARAVAVEWSARTAGPGTRADHRSYLGSVFADLLDQLAEVYTRLPDDADLIEPPELRCGTDGFHVGACDEWCWDERRWDEDERCWS